MYGQRNESMNGGKGTDDKIKGGQSKLVTVHVNEVNLVYQFNPIQFVGIYSRQPVQ